MTQVNGIAVWAEGIKAELAQRLPRQRKTQRDKLAVLVATMLHVRSANLVEVAAGLPRASDRWDMGYQWISRFLANGLVCCDDVMAPFAREILAWLAETGAPIPLILDQTKASDRHQILMLSVRWGERALPLAWRVAETEGAIGFATQQLDRMKMRCSAATSVLQVTEDHERHCVTPRIAPMITPVSPRGDRIRPVRRSDRAQVVGLLSPARPSPPPSICQRRRG